MREWRDGSFVPKKCYHCAELDICSLGCREAGKIKKGAHNSSDPWSQEPLQKNRRIPEVSFIEDNKILKVPDKIKYRKEGKDYAIYCSNTHSIILINQDFFDLVKNLYSRESFTIENLAERLGDKKMVRNTINFLNTRGLIC